MHTLLPLPRSSRPCSRCFCRPQEALQPAGSAQALWCPTDTLQHIRRDGSSPPRNPSLPLRMHARNQAHEARTSATRGETSSMTQTLTSLGFAASSSTMEESLSASCSDKDLPSPRSRLNSGRSRIAASFSSAAFSAAVLTRSVMMSRTFRGRARPESAPPCPKALALDLALHALACCEKAADRGSWED